MRKIIQITVSSPAEGGDQDILYALCDDGTVWMRCYSNGKWIQLSNVPQSDPKK